MQDLNMGFLEAELPRAGSEVADRASPPYAALFKVFFWDDWVARRFADFLTRCPGAEPWIVVDDTHGYVEGVRYERVFRTTEADMLRMGMPDEPAGKLNWYNNDYPLLAFYEVYPDFRYYVMVEHDAVVQRNLDSLVTDLAAEEIDLVGTPVKTPIEAWGWVPTLEPLWSRDRLVRFLLNVAAFSARSVAYLLQQRRQLARRYAAGELSQWPLGEGFIPSVLRDGGFRLESLDRFGSTACLDWWPPYHESDLPTLGHETFLHPVLMGKRYVESVLRYPPPETWFQPGSLLRRKLDREVPALVVPALVDALCAKRDVYGLIALRQAVDDLGWQDCAFDLDTLLAPFAMRGDAEDLALCRFAYQSSLSPWSRAPTPAGDAAHAVNGTVSGDYGFHTFRELQPWWMVDLGRPCLVQEIRIFNRLTAESARSNNLSIWRSANARGWTLVHRRASDTPFGGADGEPLIVPCGTGVVARFVRVELDGTDFLHLDEVEVWGFPFPR